jgi:hypothetical protein
MLKQILDYLSGPNPDPEFLFSILKIENHSESSFSAYRFWFDHFRKYHDQIDGDVFEFGVYRGGSLLSMALLAKRLGSNKHFYGFDTFSGFPEDGYHPSDALSNFSVEQRVTSEQKRAVEILHYIKNLTDSNASQSDNLDIQQPAKSLRSKLNTLGASGVFSDNSYEHVVQRIKLLELDNITLYPGEFSCGIKSFINDHGPSPISIFSANIDCDLYQGYASSLPFICSHLSVGGHVHLDEYYSLKYPGARIAVDEFLGVHPEFFLHRNATRPGEFERWFLTR